MQKVRKSLAAGAVIGFVLTTGAFAAPREQDGPRAPQPREAPKQQKAPKPPTKGLIAAIIDYVENQLTVPPG